MYNALNNINLNKERQQINQLNNKAPVKVVQLKQQVHQSHQSQPVEIQNKKDSGNNFQNFNVNNINLNGNIILNSRDREKDKNKIKMKEMNQKIDEFDLKLNNHNSNHIKPNSPSKHERQRPLTASQKLKKEKNNKISSSISEEKEECILDQFEKYNKNNKNFYVDKFDNNPNIKSVEVSPMIIPGSNSNKKSTPTNPMKITNLYLQDNKGCTAFFKDVMKNEYNSLEKLNIDNIDLNQFVNNIHKKISLSDFMREENNLNNQGSGIIKNEPEEVNKYLEDILKKEEINKKATLININEVHTVPMYSNHKEKNLDFRINYENNNSYHKSTEINSESVITNERLDRMNTEDSYENNEEQSGEDYEEDEENNTEDDEEVEAVENVSVIREKKENSQFMISESMKDNNEQDVKQQIVSLVNVLFIFIF
jgi:hypothetical protein